MLRQYPIDMSEAHIRRRFPRHLSAVIVQIKNDLINKSIRASQVVRV